jgi:hypothetical protein
LKERRKEEYNENKTGSRKQKTITNARNRLADNELTITTLQQTKEN